MKNIILVFVLFVGIGSTTAIIGQTAETPAPKPKKIESVEIAVKGVCKMCKKRIENAALIKGVKLAEWNKETQKLKVVYNTKKTALDKIQQAVANAGHDIGNVDAPKKSYDKLPGCCKYRDGVKVH